MYKCHTRHKVRAVNYSNFVSYYNQSYKKQNVGGSNERMRRTRCGDVCE